MTTRFVLDGSHRPPAAPRSRDRRQRVARQWQRRFRELAAPDLQRQLHRRLREDEQIFFKREGWRLGGTRDSSPAIQALQGRWPRTGRPVLERHRAGQRSGLPESSRRARLDARPFRCDACRVRPARGPHALHLQSGAVRHANRSDREVLRRLRRQRSRRGHAIARSARSRISPDVASGSLALEWPNGHFVETRHGNGHTFVTLPPGLVLAPRTLPAVPLPDRARTTPFDGHRPLGPLSLAADVHYAIDPEA